MSSDKTGEVIYGSYTVDDEEKIRQHAHFFEKIHWNDSHTYYIIFGLCITSTYMWTVYPLYIYYPVSVCMFFLFYLAANRINEQEKIHILLGGNRKAAFTLANLDISCEQVKKELRQEMRLGKDITDPKVVDIVAIRMMRNSIEKEICS